LPVWEQHGGNSFVALPYEIFYHVFSHFVVELFAENPGPGPPLRRIDILSAIFFPGSLSLRKDPAYDGDLFSPNLQVPESQRKYFLWRPVKRADMGLVILVELI